MDQVTDEAKTIIEKLYSNTHDYIKVPVLQIREALKQNRLKKSNSRYNFLDTTKNKTGVYIFTNSSDIPVYIGKGGTGSSDDLKRRIRNECKINPSEDTGARPSYNIRQHYSVLGIEKTDDEIIQILSSWNVICIPLCNQNENRNSITEYIESLLILLYKPRFNSQG